MSPAKRSFAIFAILFIAAFDLTRSFGFFPTFPNTRRRSSKLAASDMAADDRTRDCFAGRNVLLTGASGGLGGALALRLAACGAGSIVLSGRQEDALEKVEAECRELSSDTRIFVAPCDLDDPKSVSKLGAKAMELCGGPIDVLINNGGVSSRSNFVDTTIEVDAKLMQINFLSGASLAKQVVPGMKESYDGSSRKKIIWISSVQGLVGLPGRTSYAASKFAVQGYCEGLRAELATSGIDVCVASPGYIRTGLSRAAVTGDGASYGKTDPTTAQGADPDDVAKEILSKAAAGGADFVVAATASAKAAIWLRLLCPGVLQNMLVKRFEKSQAAASAEKSKDD